MNNLKEEIIKIAMFSMPDSENIKTALINMSDDDFNSFTASIEKLIKRTRNERTYS